MPLLSIVIPVYNVEKYIDECIHSILSQEFNDYEVILVDNGSTDKSSEICDKYASIYKHIKVLHFAEIMLPAGARNAGIDAAAGRYIHFCDSDDYYIDGCFSPIAEILHSSDPEVLMGQFICNPEKGAFVCNDINLDPEIINNCTADTMAEYLLRLPKLMCTPWRFILKREFLLENNLRFVEGYHVEDEEWFPRVICCASSFALLPSPMYCYRPRARGSITSEKTYMISKSQLVMAISLLGFLNEMTYKDSRWEFLLSRARFLLSLFSTRCDTFSREQLHELADIIEGSPVSFGMLGDVSQPNDLYSFISKYGAYMGLCLYRTYVIEKTLEKTYGKENSEIYVFPTGFNGEGTARILKSSGYDIKGFLDNSESKNGCTTDGLPVNLPSILKGFPEDRLRNIFVVIAIQQEHIAELIMNQLRELGLKDSQFTSRIY